MPTVDELAETLGRAERYSVKSELKRAGEVLQPGEDLIQIAVGRYQGSGMSLIMLTDQRLIAVNETGSFTKKLIVRDLALSRIVDIQTEHKRSSGEITVRTAGETFHIHGILPATHAEEISAYLRTHTGSSTATIAALTNSATPTERLARNSALLAAGAITQDEHDAIRARILAEL